MVTVLDVTVISKGVPTIIAVATGRMYVGMPVIILTSVEYFDRIAYAPECNGMSLPSLRGTVSRAGDYALDLKKTPHLLFVVSVEVGVITYTCIDAMLADSDVRISIHCVSDEVGDFVE